MLKLRGSIIFIREIILEKVELTGGIGTLLYNSVAPVSAINDNLPESMWNKRNYVGALSSPLPKLGK